MTSIITREIALSVLIECIEEGEHSHIVLRGTLEKYQFASKQDRALITKLVEGTIENLIKIDYITNQYSKVKVKKMKPFIRNLIRMSVYQILFMDRIPDSAACNEAVKLAKRKNFGNLSGFVNGVLRTIAREKDSISYPGKEENITTYLTVKYSMPEWIVELWHDTYGIELTEQICAGLLCEKKTTIRCRNHRQTVEELVSMLREDDVTAESSEYLPYALEISDYNYLKAVKAFREGRFAVQDISSMMVVELAGIKAGDFVLDVCAAPGGKSIHAADVLNGTGMVEARDLTEYKTDFIHENMERLGIENMRVAEMDALCYDTTMEEKSDVVIADLPCSGLGVIGRKKDIKYKITPDTLEELSALQKNILDVVCRYVKPGGTLMFSTCTIHQGENEENVRYFLENHKEFEAVPFYDELPEVCKNETAKEGYIQFLPGINQTDGFFIAKFRRKALTIE